MDLSREGARAIAQSGYVFLFPLVANYAAMYAEAIDPSSTRFAGGFGRWTHRRHAASLESEVAESHVTDLSSSAWLDVRAEPWLLSIPEVGTEQTTVVTDLWGLVVDVSSAAEPAGGPVAIADDAWIGAVPADVRHVVRAESSFVRSETWVRIAEPADLERVREIQRTYGIEPLSAWSVGPPPSPAPAIAWWPVDTDTTTSMAFWSAATFALSFTTRNDEDRGILDRLAEIGVVPGGRWNEGDLAPDVIHAIGEGMDEALTELMRAAGATLDRPPTRRTRPATDRDYFGRALAAIRSTPMVGSTVRARGSP